jgi:CRISPR/Cas system-associated endonuclease Cas1
MRRESLVNKKMENIKPMVQEQVAEVAAEAIGDARAKLENFNAKTNNKECKEALEKVKQYEERYGNLAKDASGYQTIKSE